MRTRLIFAPADNQTAPWMLVLGEGGAVLERRSLQLGEPPPADRTLLVVPGAEVSAHWLHLPTRNAVQARAAAAHLLEDRLALPGEEAHLAVGALEADDHRLVAVASKSRMEAWLALARLHGVAPDAIVPDHLLLPEPADEEVIAADMGGWIAVRGRRLAFSCEPEMLEVLLGERRAQIAEGEVLERLWAEGAARPAVNLLQGGFDPAAAQKVTARDLRRPALLLLALLLLPALILGVETWRYRSAAEGLQAAAVREADSVLPKGRPIGDPAAQAASHLTGLELAAGGGPVGAAASLFAAVESIEGAQLETLIASPEGVRAAISHTNYSDVELLREAMRKAGFAFKEESTRDEGGRVMSDVLVGERL